VTGVHPHAAAQIPLLLKQSLELLERKLGDYRQQTARINYFSALVGKTASFSPD
jgi:hypothetical protein